MTEPKANPIAAGAASPTAADAGLLEKMLGALTTIQESVDRFEYLQGQIDQINKEEADKEVAQRLQNIRLNVATTTLNGLLCSGAEGRPDELAVVAVQHADALIAHLGIAEDASKTPKSNP